ncbi:developmentally regulated gtp-binding protein-related [Holotrichia oblita]|nr:developmentally regulated gtp-binding protein-related [Holotrichia oblita]
MRPAKVNEIFDYYSQLFGVKPKCELNYKTDIDLLVAIILSAQCTDKRVNAVTAKLFRKYKTVYDYANAKTEELEAEIHSCGFYRAKTANIIKMAKAVVQEHKGKIPADMEKLTALAGVGRKTASVFLAECHGIPAVAVDTHVMRVSKRLGLSGGNNPVEIENDLKSLFDEVNWCDYHLFLVLFGRYYCKAREPLCDSCKIKEYCAGNGGNGHTSFYRDKLTMHGGPDGMTALKRRYYFCWKAPDGENGSKRNRTGAVGADLKIPVPLGTKIFSVDNSNKGIKENDGKGELVADITAIGQEFRALRMVLAVEDGVKTKEYKVVLELNCIADVGLIGFPNVGKSTLLSVISRANPKIANYHFTTLHPNLAVTTALEKNFIVADIPGLIEGASSGAGLGIKFLKHINRTRLLVHIVDISGHEGRDAIQDFNIINGELAGFSSELVAKPQIIALNKTDILEDKAKIEVFKKAVNKGKRKYQIVEISAATLTGVNELLLLIACELEKLPKIEAEIPLARLEKDIDKNSFEIIKKDDEFYVTGALIENLVRGVVLSDTESNAYFQRRLESSGVIDALKQRGMQDGDLVHIADIEFEYFE